MRIIINIILFLSLLISPLVTGCGTYRSDPIKGYNEFGLKCARMGLWNEAIMRWKRVIKIEPNNSQIHNNLAIAYESKGEFKVAKAEYEKAMELDPNNKIYKNNYTKFKRNYERITKIQNAKDKMQSLEDKEQGIKDKLQELENEN